MSNTKSKGLIQVMVAVYLIEFVRSSFLMGYLPFVTLGSTALIATGTAVTAHFLSDAVSNASIGSLLRLLKGRLVLHLGFTCCLTGLALAGSEQTWALFAGSCLLGLGMVPVWITALCEATGKDRGKRMALVYSAWMGGLASGAVLSNIMVDLYSSAVFWGMVGMIVLAWLFVMNLQPPEQREEGADRRFNIAALGMFLKRSTTLLPGIVLQGIATGMLLPLLPVFAIQFLHLSNTEYGLLLAVGGIAAFAVILPFGKLADRIGQLPPVVSGFTLCAVSLFIFILHPPVWLMYVDALLLGIGYAVYLPAWNAFMAAFIDVSFKEAGWGIISSVQGVSVMLGPVLGGVLMHFWTVPDTLMVTALLFGMMALYYLGYGSFKRRILS